MNKLQRRKLVVDGDGQPDLKRNKGGGEPMQMLRKRISASLFAACLLVALTFGAGVALASGSNTLTVTTENNDTLAADVQSGKLALEVDVYQVAPVVEDKGSGTYEVGGLNAPFATADIQTEFDKALAGKGDWAKVAEMAKACASNAEPYDTMTISEATSGNLTVEDGMYLIVARDAQAKISDKKVRNYAFLPSLISLPTKYSVYYGEGASENAPKDGMTTANSGKWNTAVTIAIKPQVEEKTKPTPPPSSSTTSSTHKSSSSSHKSSSSSRSTVRTGDDADITPFVVAMAVSGVLLIGLFVYGRRRLDREE